MVRKTIAPAVVTNVLKNAYVAKTTVIAINKMKNFNDYLKLRESDDSGKFFPSSIEEEKELKNKKDMLAEKARMKLDEFVKNLAIAIKISPVMTGKSSYLSPASGYVSGEEGLLNKHKYVIPAIETFLKELKKGIAKDDILYGINKNEAKKMLQLAELNTYPPQLHEPFLYNHPNFWKLFDDVYRSTYGNVLSLIRPEEIKVKPRKRLGLRELLPEKPVKDIKKKGVIPMKPKRTLPNRPKFSYEDLGID